MIPVSRKRGLSAETIIDDRRRDDTSAATRTSGSSSQVHVGSTPATRMKTKHRRPGSAPRLKRPVSTTASGITSRGNWVLRTIDSEATIEPTASDRRLLEEAEEHDVEQQQHRVLLHALAEVERLREDEAAAPRTATAAARATTGSRAPCRSSCGELGDGDQVEQVGGAPPPASERRRAANLAQLGSRIAHGSPRPRRSGVDGHDALARPRCRRRRSRAAAAGAARCRPARGCGRRSTRRSSGRAAAGSRSCRRAARARRPARRSGRPSQLAVEAEDRVPVGVDERECRRSARRAPACASSTICRPIGSPCSTVSTRSPASFSSHASTGLTLTSQTPPAGSGSELAWSRAKLTRKYRSAVSSGSPM